MEYIKRVTNKIELMPAIRLTLPKQLRIELFQQVSNFMIG